MRIDYISSVAVVTLVLMSGLTESSSTLSVSTVPTLRNLRSSVTLQDIGEERRVIIDESSVKQIFNIVKDKNSQILDIVLHQKLENMIDFMRTHNPNMLVRFFLLLTNQYGEKTLIATMEEYGRKPKFKSLVRKLEHIQMESWVADHNSPQEIFNRLKNYFTNEQIVQKAQNEIAINDEATKDFAGQLKKQVFDEWVNAKLTPEKALVLLRLDRNDAPFQSQYFTPWVEYLNNFNDKWQDSQTTIIEVLLRKFEDKKVVFMLHSAKMSSATSGPAMFLERDLLQAWYKQKLSPMQVFDLLNDASMRSSSRHILVETGVLYLNFLIKKGNDAKIMFQTLSEHIFSKMTLFEILQGARKYDRMQLYANEVLEVKADDALKLNKSPEEVFFLLGLNWIGDSLLSDQFFKKWMMYEKNFNIKSADNHVSWVMPLIKAYNYSRLYRIIEKGRQNPSTKNMAEELEQAMIENSLNKKESPDVFFIRLGLHLVGENLNESDLSKLETWSNYMTKFNNRFPDTENQPYFHK